MINGLLQRRSNVLTAAGVGASSGGIFAGVLTGVLTVMLLLTAFVGGGVQAAESNDVLFLDLDDVIARALENDAGYLLSRNEVRASEIQLEQAEAGNLIQPNPILLFQAQIGLELAQRGLELKRQELLLEVEKDYYNILRLQNLLQVMDEAIRLAERQVEVAQQRFDSGEATLLDVIQAKSVLAGHKADRAQLEDNLALAQNKLLYAIGLPRGTQFVLDATVVTQELPNISLDEALAEGLANRVELLQAQAGVDIAEKELALAMNDYTPPLTRRAAEVKVASAHLQLRQAREGISLDIQNAYNQMLDAYRRLEVTELALEEALETHRVVQALFDVGMATDVEILQAQTGLAKANSDRVHAIYDFNIARATFFRAIGWGTEARSARGE